MIVVLLIGLVLIATAVAIFSRALVAGRLRTADTLGKIRRYGFVASAEPEAATGVRGFLDPAASGLGSLFSDRLRLLDEDRLRKQLLTAGMYQTLPRELIGYSVITAVALPAIWITLAVAAGVKPALTVVLVVFLAAGGWLAPGFV